ncbi:MAG: carbohydrate ABC transporter permease [Firmicutes bacterium]|jgi:multiple sugar transport system permease protein|nr:carbohydrate ABC transporter permease [Bacillota bacterium]
MSVTERQVAAGNRTLAADPRRWELGRARWARAAAVYVMLLAFSFLFTGPFLFAVLSSLKDNPTEWPPRLDPPQLSPVNWGAAWRLGRTGGGGGFFGAFAPGAVVPFRVTYELEEGETAVPPIVTVPRRVAGAGAAALRLEPFAADAAKVSEPREVGREAVGSTTHVTYEFEISHTGTMTYNKLPLDVEVPLYQKFVKATLSPNRIERLGRVQSWNNITGGLIPYVFQNYNRVFRENYSRSTGRSLFLTWIRNSLLVAAVRVLTTLLIASMAGYALARLRFRGRQALFVLTLFSMMIPGQVTFISNYLVLRDGIFGLSRLFGAGSLLNTWPGFLISTMVGGSAVFIMKQFFEGLPKDLEESARIDGATTIQTFFRIMLPLSKPALGALAILTFQGAWNEFFWPLIVLTSPQDRYTLTIGLLNFRSSYAVAFDWGPMLAGAVVSALPIIVLFVVFQRYFVEGISFTGIKG